MLFAIVLANEVGEVGVEVFGIEVFVHFVPFETLLLLGGEALARFLLFVDSDEFLIAPDAATVFGRAFAFAFDERHEGLVLLVVAYGGELYIVIPRISKVVFPLDRLAFFCEEIGECVLFLVVVAGWSSEMICGVCFFFAIIYRNLVLHQAVLLGIVVEGAGEFMMMEGAEIFGGDVWLLKFVEGSNDNFLWNRRSAAYTEDYKSGNFALARVRIIYMYLLLRGPLEVFGEVGAVFAFYGKEIGGVL